MIRMRSSGHKRCIFQIYFLYPIFVFSSLTLHHLDWMSPKECQTDRINIPPADGDIDTRSDWSSSERLGGRRSCPIPLSSTSYFSVNMPMESMYPPPLSEAYRSWSEALLLVLRAFFLAGFFFFTSSLDLILHPLHLEPGFLLTWTSCTQPVFHTFV